MAALIGFAALLLTASIQAAAPLATAEASAPADAEENRVRERPDGDGEQAGANAPAVRRPPDDSELDSNAVVDFPQDI